MNENPNETQVFQEMGFEIEKTKDNSPTLRMLNGTDRGGESMHHTGGAFSETCLIYGQAFQKGFQVNPDPQIVSLGLGLGYVEVLAVVYSMRYPGSRPVIYSYETVDGLKTHFKEFYEEGKASTQFAKTYQWILKQMAETYGFKTQDIQLQVQKAFKENRLQLLGNFTAEMNSLKSFDIFCYDAYSKKTSPELWNEALMTELFSKGSKTSCVSSYASNGVLKRSLVAAGYQVEVLEGFQGKRNRTWAYRPH